MTNGMICKVVSKRDSSDEGLDIVEESDLESMRKGSVCANAIKVRCRQNDLYVRLLNWRWSLNERVKK